MSLSLSLGPLQYPIVVAKVLKEKGDVVSKADPIFEYRYLHWFADGVYGRGEEKGKEAGETKWKSRVMQQVWSCPVNGTIKEMTLERGERIEESGKDKQFLLVAEDCSHDVQFQGLCGMCGKDMTAVSWAADAADTARAPINMTHDNTGLLVSEMTAQKTASEAQTRLLDDRKLSLVVDLDQTIIHACIEPTVGEWQRDPTNPNYPAIKDVESFQLNDDGPRGLATGCWYYIKKRPALKEFLEQVSELYELHVYTMGTRAYAQNIAKLVDPDQKLFGNRLISRDENHSITSKSLERLFPTSTGMVAIIDDRADVWPADRDNLIKVTPYDFFKGIGDINSSFLPKRQDIALIPDVSAQPDPATSAALTPTDPATSTTTRPAEPNGNKTGDNLPSESLLLSCGTESAKGPSGLEKNESGQSEDAKPQQVDGLPLPTLAAAVGGDTILRQKQSEEQKDLLEKQLTERPLLHLQEQLDKEDQVANSSTELTTAGESADTSSVSPTGQDSPLTTQPSPSQQRHNILIDDDTELIHLANHLARLHDEFYQRYDRARLSHNELSKGGDDGVDGSLVPDVGQVLRTMKKRVLRGNKIVLSGLVPTDMAVRDSELGRQIRSFGAKVRSTVTPKTTHLVVSTTRPGYQKMREAAAIPSIKIVNQNWLADSLTQWRIADTEPYKVHVRLPVRVDSPRDKTDDDSEAVDKQRQRKKKIVDNNLDLVNGSEEDDEDGEQDEDNDEEGEEDGGAGQKQGDYGTETEESEDSGDSGEEMDPDDVVELNENMDWNLVNDQLADFLGSSDEDEEDDEEEQEEEEEEEGGSEYAAPVANGHAASAKRKLDESEDESGSESGSGAVGAASNKRQRTTTGGSGLKYSVLPTPDGSGGGSGTNGAVTVNGFGDMAMGGTEWHGDEDSDDLEAFMEAGLDSEEDLHSEEDEDGENGEKG